MCLIDDRSECNFLDNRWLWLRKAGAAICAVMSARPTLRDAAIAAARLAA
jgi:hypothetical protein